MNKIIFTKKEVLNILYDESTLEIEQSAGKHDCTWFTYVIKKDGKFYMLRVEQSYNDGIMLYGDSVEAIEVEPFEKTVTDWKIVE